MAGNIINEGCLSAFYLPHIQQTVRLDVSHFRRRFLRWNWGLREWGINCTLWQGIIHGIHGQMDDPEIESLPAALSCLMAIIAFLTLTAETPTLIFCIYLIWTEVILSPGNHSRPCSILLLPTRLRGTSIRDGRALQHNTLDRPRLERYILNLISSENIETGQSGRNFLQRHQTKFSGVGGQF